MSSNPHRVLATPEHRTPTTAPEGAPPADPHAELPDPPDEPIAPEAEPVAEFSALSVGDEIHLLGRTDDPEEFPPNITVLDDGTLVFEVVYVDDRPGVRELRTHHLVYHVVRENYVFESSRANGQLTYRRFYTDWDGHDWTLQNRNGRRILELTPTQ